MRIHPQSGIIVFEKRSILNVWQCSEYASASACSIIYRVTLWYAYWCFKRVRLNPNGIYLVILLLGIKWAQIIGTTKTQRFGQNLYGYVFRPAEVT